MKDITQDNQEDLIDLINSVSNKLTQPATLQYLLHQEGQFDLLAIANNGLIAQATQNK